jgi:hypothetical protein
MSNELMTTSNKENYVIVQDEEGKFSRKAKYEAYCSIVPQNRQEKIDMLNLLEGSDENTNGLKDHVGKQFEIANVIFRPYDKINEETGAEEYGVLTYLITPDGIPYVTSSKSVYFSMKRIFDVFGEPNSEEWENIIVKVIQKKGLQYQYVDVKMVG